MPVLHTDRLRLRPLTRHDQATITTIMGDWRVARMLSDAPFPFSEEAARRLIRLRWGELRLGIEHHGRLIGCVGYFHCPGNSAELGYWLAPEAWGRGFAQEAAGRLIAHGFTAEGLSEFHASHFADNPASARLLQRLGFLPVARGRAPCPARGCEVTAISYRLERTRAGLPALAPVLAVLPRTVRRLIWQVGLAPA
jgi:RimJ/RimL family protein N-acetyltransferase